MSQVSIHRRITALLVALCVLFSFASVGPGTARAAFDGVVKGFTEGRDTTTIDPAHPASLTIRVQQENPFNGPDKYGRLPGSPEGYTVVATRIPGVDLTQPATWETLRGFVFDNKETIATGRRFTAVTDTGGRATIDPLPVGAYYVTVDPPEDDEHRLFEVDPMVVTVPVGGEKDWKYDVEVAVKGVGFTRPYPPQEEPPVLPPELFVPAISIPILIWLIPLLPVFSSGDSTGIPAESPKPPATEPEPVPEPPAQSGRGLAVTGAPVNVLVALGLLVMLAGLGVVLATGRRPTRR